MTEMLINKSGTKRNKLTGDHCTCWVGIAICKCCLKRICNSHLIINRNGIAGIKKKNIRCSHAKPLNVLMVNHEIENQESMYEYKKLREKYVLNLTKLY